MKQLPCHSKKACQQQLWEILDTTWGYKQFRVLQEEAVQGTLQGRDILLILPTGVSRVHGYAFDLRTLMSDKHTSGLDLILIVPAQKRLQQVSCQFIHSRSTKCAIA